MTNHELIRLLEAIYRNSDKGSKYLYKGIIKSLAAANMQNYESLLDIAIDLDYITNFKDDLGNECYQLTQKGIDYVKENSTIPTNKKD